MSGTNETDWAYLSTLVGLPILFAATMIYLYIYTRRRRRSLDQIRPYFKEKTNQPDPPK